MNSGFMNSAGNMSSVTIPVPHPGATINQPILKRGITRGLYSGQRVFASLVEYMAPSDGGQPQSTIPQDAAIPKYFNSHSPYGVFIDGSLSLDGIYTSAFSDESFSIYSKTLADFYRDRVRAKDPEFATIPRLVLRPLPDFDKLNFAPDIGKNVDALRAGRVVSANEQPWAFGSIIVDPTGPIERDGVKFRAMWPSNMGLKYENGLPVAFDYQEYDRAFPLTTVVSVGGGAAGGTPKVKSGQEEAFLAAAGAAYFAPDRVLAANNVVKQFVEVK